MSYSHTKRRKNIKKWKKKFPDNWYGMLRARAHEVKKKQEGVLVGSLEELLK